MKSAQPADASRVIVESVRPCLDGGRFPAKATRGLRLEISVVIFTDGTDRIIADLEYRPPDSAWDGPTPLADQGNDQWTVGITPGQAGPAAFRIVAAIDRYGSWLRDLRARVDAGQHDELPTEFEAGALLAETQATLRTTRAPDRAALRQLATALRAPTAVAERMALAERAATVTLARRTADRGRATVAGPFPLFVDRPLAGFSAWYEMFPRSEGAEPPRSGSFRSAAKRLPGIAAMGFDIVYLPPIHPIGKSHRKGPNNTLHAGPNDPGSPWAIGDAGGGHDAIHPGLGALEDFRWFCAEAKRHGLEVALDFALQCSPDHPWVRDHPEWFRHRSDGTIRYAENPPKRYQDIVPLDFDCADRAGLWEACRELVQLWVDRGIRIFRVDNPHTKPIPFWDWLIADIRRDRPEVIFLAEAFTRPRVMERLAKGGFTQSYTYFTWRNTKHVLAEYLNELAHTDRVDFLRPNFWVNTPDILHQFLQRGGMPAFKIRAVLAALTCPSWGMYSGYELGERVPAHPGSEEYLSSEKYQLRPRQWDDPGSLAPFITRLNQIRRHHREAVAQLRTLHVHHVDNDNMLCVSRSAGSEAPLLLVVVNLDPFATHEAMVHLDLPVLGLRDGHPFEVHDGLTGATYTWCGSRNYVKLSPAMPAHVLTVQR